MIDLFAFIALCAAGGLGAALRFAIDGMIKERSQVPFPWATTLINVTGSLFLGLLLGFTAHSGVSPTWLLVLGGGLMGGYTTFSTASFETFRLAQQRRYLAAVVNGVGMLILAVAAAGCGLWAGATLASVV